MSDATGFIGLGQLGLPMATNLLDAGYALTVYNRTASKADPLVARGARLAPQPMSRRPAGSSRPSCGTTRPWRASSRATVSWSGWGRVACIYR